MKKVFAVVFGLLFLGASAVSQSISISANVVDSDTTVWANGTWQLDFVPNPATPGLGQYYYNNGGTAQHLVDVYGSYLHQTGAIDGSGNVISAVALNNTLITPVGSQWKLTLCPKASSKCGNLTFAVTSGPTWTVPSANITAAIPAPRFDAVSGSYGYADVEAITSVAAGGTYWNVTSNIQECYTGSVWQSCSSANGKVNPAAQFSVFGQQGSGTQAVASAIPNMTADANGNLSPYTSQPKTSPVYDIRAYGAVLDGVHDDGPAIRSAIAAAITGGGGEVYIPAGTAYIGTSDPEDPTGSFINIDGNHIHVHCDERAKITTAASSTLTLFRFGYPFNGRPPMQTTTSYNINPITYAGSSTIVLTTPTDISNFAVGDPIYIKGGPGIESNTDGEVNWVTALDPGTGTITLLKPTGKPYAGNVANGGSVTTASVADGGAWSNGGYSDTSAFFYDDSIDGCIATVPADFVFVGQIIGMKVTNNTVTVEPGATRGMMINSFYPFADLTVSHNIYNQESLTGSSIYQLAEGQRDVIIDGNDFSTVAAMSAINPSEGVLNASITNNKIYQTVPPGTAQINLSAIMTSTAYNLLISGNSITLNNPNSTQQHGIDLGLSNGTCTHCVVSHNSIILNGGNGYGIFESGGTQKPVANIVGNTIQTTKGGMSLSGTNTVEGNTIYMMGSPAGSNSIVFGAGDTTVSNNLIYSTSNVVNGIVMNSASGTGLIEGNLIDGAANAVALQNGALPFIANNQCVNVTDTGHYCNSTSWSDVQLYRSGSNALKATGALTVGSINSVVNAASESGATADVKIAAACAALPASGGVIDLRGFGASTQTVAATISCGSATKQVTFITDKSVRFVPSNSSVSPIFNLAEGNIYKGSLYVDTSGVAGWTGSVMAASGNIGDVFPSKTEVQSLYCNGTAQQGTCVNFTAGNNSHIVFVKFDRIQANAMAYGVYLYANESTSGDYAWVNGNTFAHLTCLDTTMCVNINRTGTASATQVSENHFPYMQVEMSGSSAYKAIDIGGTGTGFNVSNDFIGLALFDGVSGTIPIIFNSGSYNSRVEGYLCGGPTCNGQIATFGGNGDTVVDWSMSGGEPSTYIPILDAAGSRSGYLLNGANGVELDLSSGKDFRSYTGNGGLLWAGGTGSDHNLYINSLDTDPSTQIDFEKAVQVTGTLTLPPLGTATSSNNYGSNVLDFQDSIWNGTTNVTNNFSMSVVNGSGVNPYEDVIFKKNATPLFTILANSQVFAEYGNQFWFNTATVYEGHLIAPTGGSSTFDWNLPSASGTLALTPGTQAWGTAALVSGTATVSTTAACIPGSTCIYTLTRCGVGASTAIGSLAVGTTTAGTSFVINSLSSTAGVVSGDTSVVCWRIN